MAKEELPEEVSTELQQAMDAIAADFQKSTCDLPSCDAQHQCQATLRMGRPRTIDFHFCSHEHKQEAAALWGLQI